MRADRQGRSDAHEAEARPRDSEQKGIHAEAGAQPVRSPVPRID